MVFRMITLGLIFILISANKAYTQHPISAHPYLLFSDTAYQDAYTADPALSLFVELGGKFWYTVNIDRRWSEQQAISAGVGYCTERNYDDEGNDQSVWIMDVMYYRFLGARKRLETAIGTGLTGTTASGLASAALHGVLGYRLQRRDGFLFRAGFTPLMSFAIDPESRSMFIPFIGISFGYSF